MTNDEQDSLIALNGLDDSRQALLAMLEGMRRTLCLYTPLVRAELYDDADILAAVSYTHLDVYKRQVFR